MPKATSGFAVVMGWLFWVSTIEAQLVEQEAPQPPTRNEDAAPPTGASLFGHGTGPTEAIQSMAWLAGHWEVTMTYFGPAGPVFTGSTESTIEPLLSGGFLEERITVPAGPALNNSMIGIRSFDRYRGIARVVWFDQLTTLADVYEGPVDGGGFVVTNLKSGTSGIFAGRESYMRITQTPGATRDEFMLVWEVSSDQGQTWMKTAEYAYKRKG